jgi:hypothetical protein
MIAEEAAQRVRVPVDRGYDLRRRHAFGVFHQRDSFGLLVGAVRLSLLGMILGRAGFLRGPWLSWRAEFLFYMPDKTLA